MKTLNDYTFKFYTNTCIVLQRSYNHLLQWRTILKYFLAQGDHKFILFSVYFPFFFLISIITKSILKYMKWNIFFWSTVQGWLVKHFWRYLTKCLKSKLSGIHNLWVWVYYFQKLKSWLQNVMLSFSHMIRNIFNFRCSKYAIFWSIQILIFLIENKKNYKK